MLNQARQICAAAGVLALLALAFVADGVVSDRLALLAFTFLGFATVFSCGQLVRRGWLRPATLQMSLTSSRQWLIVTFGVALLTALAAQSWFHPGTSIASGDIGLPDGTAWIERLFEPWSWSGSNLGEPSQLPLALPWAAILGVVHWAGGDPGLAQRVWYTALFAGAALGALGLLWALRLSPIAAAIGAAVYVLNGFVISSVNTNPVFLAALLPLVAMPAALVAAGTGRLSIRWSVLITAGTAPLVGYVFFNPPLVGMILAATLVAPALVAWIDGREAGIRSLRALLLAIPLFLGLSAYWIVAANLHLRGFSSGQFATTASWSWTETRATIRNAFWLNNTWGWNFPEYYPYATAYDRLPLSVARFILPAIAFGSLSLGTTLAGPDATWQRDRLRRISAAVAAVALLLILLSTGTNPPGNTIFNALYNLPFGWLLREPGRFLMLAGLAYAVLTAVTVDALFSPALAEFVRSPHPLQSVRHLSAPALQLAVGPVALVTAILVGFPMYTGAVVPDSRTTLPPAHVQMPAYWRQMAGFVDHMPTQGGLLVLPPDDFYAMPYSWGYYGADNFVVDLFQRPVLIPNSQGGYVSTSDEVLSAVNITADSILRHDWRQADELVTALNTPLVLVRRDIVATAPGRSILSPSDLADALTVAPDFVLVRRIGALDLYALKSALPPSEGTMQYVMANTQTPDLRLLGLLPSHTAIVSGNTQAGVVDAIFAPPLEQWLASGNTAVWRPISPPGSTYRIANLDTKAVVPLDRSGVIGLGTPAATAAYEPSAPANVVTVSVTGRSAISGDNFVKDPQTWVAVADCAATSLHGHVITGLAPGGLPALVLSAASASECRGQTLDWHGGSLLVRLMVNRVQGRAPRICLFESGPARCLPAAGLPTKQGWSTYQTVVTPEVGTSAITLVLYADGAGSRNETVIAYADVSVVELTAPQLVLLADTLPQAQPINPLFVVHSSFSTQWHGSAGTKHVLVDGMLNGWLAPAGSRVGAEYQPAGIFRAAQWVSLVALVVLLLLTSYPRLTSLIRARLRPHQSQPTHRP